MSLAPELPSFLIVTGGGASSLRRFFSGEGASPGLFA